jgi:hypothetical protein
MFLECELKLFDYFLQLWVLRSLKVLDLEEIQRKHYIY